MNMLSALRVTVAASVLVLLPVLTGTLRAAASEAQTNREGPVTVKVTPRSLASGNLSPQAGNWEFEIVLETHTAALDQDLSRAAVLVDSSGTTQTPLAWEGDPPGGHHRKGVLRFSPLPGSPEFVELRIRGIGGVSERVFRWRTTGTARKPDVGQ